MLQYHFTHSIVLDSSSFTPWIEPKLNMLNHWKLSRPSTSSSSHPFGPMLVQHYFFASSAALLAYVGATFSWSLERADVLLTVPVFSAPPGFNMWVTAYGDLIYLLIHQLTSSPLLAQTSVLTEPAALLDQHYTTSTVRDVSCCVSS